MGHGHDQYKNLIPKDHTIYKPDEIPHLVALKERLAKKGLKDPWMRNEVWRYKYQETPMYMRVLEVCGGFRSIGLGIGIAAVGAVITKWCEPDHHHEEGDGKHH